MVLLEKFCCFPTELFETGQLSILDDVTALCCVTNPHLDLPRIDPGLLIGSSVMPVVRVLGAQLHTWVTLEIVLYISKQRYPGQDRQKKIFGP